MTALRLRRPPRDLGPAALSFTLSLIAGMVDVASFVLLNGLFAAHITGNVVVLAADVALGRPVRLSTALAVAVFIAVTAAFTVAVDISRRKPYRWAPRFLWWQFILLATTAVAAPVLGPMVSLRTSVEVALAVLAVGAMACQNALLHLTFERAPTTAVMTGNVVAATVALVGLALGRFRADPAPGEKAGRDTDRTQWHALWPLLLGFAAGCVVGAIGSGVVGWWVWVGPASVSGVLAAGVAIAGVPIRLRRDS
jgi:uncharacterized membrane protein YoaK (UPF0700 family)